MFLADFHVHSTFSDGKMTIPQLVDFYGQQGFGAIAITDHLCESQSLLGVAARYIGHTLTPESFPAYLAILQSEGERARHQYGMLLIAGVELSKNNLLNDRSAHIVALGISEFLSADLDPLELSKKIREMGGVSIAAHPVSTRKIEKQTYGLWNRRQDLATAFDAWEVASGPYLFSEVWKSGLPMIANSDLHAPRQIRSWKTAFECEKNPEAIFDAIRRQKLDFKFYEGDWKNANLPGLWIVDPQHRNSGLEHLDRPEAL